MFSVHTDPYTHSRIHIVLIVSLEYVGTNLHTTQPNTHTRTHREREVKRVLSWIISFRFSVCNIYHTIRQCCRRAWTHPNSTYIHTQYAHHAKFHFTIDLKANFNRKTVCLPTYILFHIILTAASHWVCEPCRDPLIHTYCTHLHVKWNLPIFVSHTSDACSHNNVIGCTN